MALTYSKTVPFHGDPAKALEMAANWATHNNFKIVNRTHESIETVNSIGLYYKHQPAQGLGKLKVRVRGGLISIEGDFTDLRRLGLGTIIFLFGLGLFLMVIFMRTGDKQSPLLAFLPLAPWPIILPLMFWHMKRRIVRTLDNLLNNCTQNI